MRCFQACLGVLALLLSISQASGVEYSCRWVYVSRGLHKDQDVEDIRGIVKTAAEHRLNGMVLAAGLDRLDRQPAQYLQRLEAVKQTCAERRIEIIPIIFSAGYGGSILAYDRNLAEGLLVKDARFLVRGQEARLQTDFPVEIPNGGFEDHTGDRVRGCRFHDLPSKVSFVDTRVAKEGQASLRFEDFGQFPHGHARVMFEVPVRPYRCYRLAGWVKTENLQPAGCFHIQVLTGDRSLAPISVRVASTSDWRPVVVGFNSMGYDKVRIYAGVWGGKQGRFWLDGLRIEEVGLVNVLRRPGTLLKVQDESSGTVYEEGRDFAPIADPKLTFRLLVGEKKSKRSGAEDSLEHAKSIGYSEQELAGIPEGVVCRGCGNPTALAELKEGETVLDVGSGGGLDALLAARRVGPTGRVIGIDSSAEAVAKATASAAKGNYANVVFKQGDMGKLPLADQSVDVVISNCAMNYAGDKLAVFKEVLRCLKPNGRIVVTDLVVERGFSDEVLQDKVWGEWLRRAVGKQDYLKTIEKAGFKEVAVVRQTSFPMAESDERLRGKILSIAVKARK